MIQYKEALCFPKKSLIIAGNHLNFLKRFMKNTMSDLSAYYFGLNA